MILIPILTIFGFSYLFSNCLKTKFIFAVPVVTSLLVSLLYCAATVNLLPAATYLFYFLGTIYFAYYYTQISKDDFLKNIKPCVNEIISLSIIIIAFFIYTSGSYLHAYDDFCHWGVFTKELLHFGFFENQNSASSIITTHAHYPRGSAVYHYFMLLLSGYSEGNVLFAHFLLHLIFLAPLTANRKFWSTIFFISVILAIVVLYTTGLRSIYNDSTIGLMFGCIFAIYILEEDKHKAMLLALPIVILLTFFREVGLWLASFASIIIISHHIKFYKGGRNKKDYIIYFLLLTLPIMCNFIWLSYFKNTHDFFGRREHSFSNIVVIIENFNEQHKLLLLNYGKFFLKFLVKEGSIALYIIGGLAWYSVRKYKPSLLREYKFLLVATFICYLIFALWRLYLYFFTFTYAEAIKGASLLRYLGCYSLAFGIISCAYIKNSIFLFNQNKKELFIFAVLLVVASFSVVKNTLRIKQLSPAQKVFNEQSSMVKELLEQGVEVNFDFGNKQDGLQCYILNYSLAPYLNNKYLKECMQAPKNSVINKDLSEENKIIYRPFVNEFDIKK